MRGPLPGAALRCSNVRQVFGSVGLRWGAEGEDRRLGVALVSQLDSGSGLEEDHASLRGLDELGRIAQGEGRGSGEDDEHLVLDELSVPTATRPWWMAPNVRPHVSERIREPDD